MIHRSMDTLDLIFLQTKHRPGRLTFQAVSIPDGSVMNSLGLPSESNPAISVEIPNGRTPGICVYLYKSDICINY